MVDQEAGKGVTAQGAGTAIPEVPEKELRPAQVTGGRQLTADTQEGHR